MHPPIHPSLTVFHSGKTDHHTLTVDKHGESLDEEVAFGGGVLLPGGVAGEVGEVGEVVDVVGFQALLFIDASVER